VPEGPARFRDRPEANQARLPQIEARLMLAVNSPYSEKTT
jgi:hypothetical protein